MHVRGVYEGPQYHYIVTDNLDHPALLLLLVMPTLQQSSIQDATNKGGSVGFGPHDVATLVRTLLDALAYLQDPHNRRRGSQSTPQPQPHAIVHGKIHPKNILVPKGGSLDSLVLVDFSAAHFEDTAVDNQQDSSDSIDSSEGDEESAPKNDKKKKKTKTKTKTKQKTAPGHFDPPEYATQSAATTAAGDMWALGVLTFLLLTGRYPFAKPSDFDQPIQEWYGIQDPRCRVFLQRLLALRPEDRPTAASFQNCTNEWFHQPLEEEDPIRKSVASNDDWDAGDVMYRLGNLHREHAFQVAVRSYIATHVMLQSERRRLDRVFRLADKNHSHGLSRDEFATTMRDVCSDLFDEQTIANCFDVVDANGDGTISYEEFMAFAEDREQLLQKKNLRAAFDAFDWSHTDYITAEDLQRFSSSSAKGGAAVFQCEKIFSHRTIRAMMKRADKNGDGRISFDEFCDMMLGTHTASYDVVEESHDPDDAGHYAALEEFAIANPLAKWRT